MALKISGITTKSISMNKTAPPAMISASFLRFFLLSNRTISRWETGSNLPDISLLVEIADFYELDIREILIGERDAAIFCRDPIFL